MKLFCKNAPNQHQHKKIKLLSCKKTPSITGWNAMQNLHNR